MLDIAWSELLLVAIVAILVVGPKELPALLRSLGRMVGKLRSTADEFRKYFDEAVREAGGEDLQREMRALKSNNPLNQVRDSIEEMGRDPLSSGGKKEAPKPSDEADSGADDELGPPPPLPPKDASDTATSPEPRAASSTDAEAASEPAASSSNGAETSNGSGHEIRVNGEHRATN